MSDIVMKEITIQTIAFEIAQPYATGHTCSEAEAKALNQTRSENIRNNTATLVKAALKEAGVTEVTAEDGEVSNAQNELSDDAMLELIDRVAEYDNDYEFTMASVGAGRASRDPVEVEAMKIARASVTAGLKEAGHTVKSYTHDEAGELIESQRDKLNAVIANAAAQEAVIAEAKSIVASRVALAKADISDLGL
tara:strand:+ start:283 stop:864 length:582 start_codon:yes stop_codon:yes gene_type:complete